MRLSHPDLLVEEAFAWVARRARLELPPAHVDPAAKWIVRSSWQKNVRRGQTDRAVAMALALHAIDSRYVWRAALTIALEDVGFGSPDTVLWATAAQTASFRKAVGELPLLIALTREMAGSLKSRAAVELSFIVDTSQPETFRPFGDMTTDQLLARFADDDPYEAYVALSVLRGIVPTGYRMREADRRGVMAAGEIIHDQQSGQLSRAAQATLLRPLDNMSMGFVVGCRLAQENGDADILADPMPESRLIEGFPSEAYDQHERLGRQAIRRFGLMLVERHYWLRSLPRSSCHAAIADAVFIEEGQCLDRWISGPALLRLRQDADEIALTRHGLTAAQAIALRRLVRDAANDLNLCREALVSVG